MGAPDRKACPDTWVSHRQISDQVEEELEAWVNFVIIPVRGVGWGILEGESTGVEVEECEDLGEGVQVEEVVELGNFPSVVEGAFEQDMVAVMGCCAGIMMAGALSGLISTRTELGTVCTSNSEVGEGTCEA